VGLGPFAPLVALFLLVLGSIDDPFEGPGERVETSVPAVTQTFGRAFCETGPLDQAPAEAGIAVEREAVRPGEAAYARVEAGPRGATFGAEYRVERLVGGNWQQAPGGPRVFVQVELGLGADQSGYCNQYVVPDDASPGRYRFSRDLGEGGAAKRTATAEFRVRG
jgi:hypothetical protein